MQCIAQRKKHEVRWENTWEFFFYSVDPFLQFRILHQSFLSSIYCCLKSSN